MAIDTLEYARKLEAAGVDRKQAEAHAEAARDAFSDQIASKADIGGLAGKIDRSVTQLETRIAQLDAKIDRSVTQLESRITQLDGKLDRSIAELESRLIKYMVGQTFAIVALVFALLRLLPA